MDLRECVVAFVKDGGCKVEAAKLFKISRRSVYRYLDADKKGCLEPKKSWGRWRKLDPEKLAAHVSKHPEATLKQMQEVFKASHKLPVPDPFHNLGQLPKLFLSHAKHRLECSLIPGQAAQ